MSMMHRIAMMLALLAVPHLAHAKTRAVWVGAVRYLDADSTAASATTFDDAAWQRRSFHELPRAAGVRWVRARVRVDRPAPQHAPSGYAIEPAGVFIAALASHELWWDGVFIGAGGRVGSTPAEETPGPIEMVHAIPDSLATRGEHVLALRMSSFHQRAAFPNPYWWIGVGSYGELLLACKRSAWGELISLSGILVGALLAFATYLMHRRDRAAFMLAALGGAAALLLAAEAWRPLVGYPYPLHATRVVVLTTLTWVVGALLVGFVVARYSMRGNRPALGVALAALTIAPFLSPSWDMKLILMHAVALVFAVIWTARAAFARRRGAWLALIGTGAALVALLVDMPGFLDRGYYYAMDAMLVALLIGHLLEWRDQVSAADRARARSASLEAELLKRHLQPHFLMNTLTAIAGWIEEDPPTAVRMIGALGDELRVLTRVSDRVLVPLAEELRLCRAHLETMSLRRDVSYGLEIAGIEESAMLPPAVIHTLIENAVTHGTQGAGVVTMRLRAVRDGGRCRYEFVSPCGAAADRVEAGTGTRYVVARLREAWGDDWSMEQGEAAGDWRVTIDVPHVVMGAEAPAVRATPGVVAASGSRGATPDVPPRAAPDTRPAR